MEKIDYVEVSKVENGYTARVIYEDDEEDYVPSKTYVARDPETNGGDFNALIAVLNEILVP